jgi:hypothetical protein
MLKLLLIRKRALCQKSCAAVAESCAVAPDWSKNSVLSIGPPTLPVICVLTLKT